MGIFRQFPYSNFHEMNMDEIIKIVREMLDEWVTYKANLDQLYSDITTAFEAFKAEFDEFIASIDVNAEFDEAFQRLIASGEFMQLVQPVCVQTASDVTTAWLAAHITQPTTPAIDNTLTIAGAAADAKATGDAIDYLTEQVKNNDSYDLLDPLMAGKVVSMSGAGITFTDNHNGTWSFSGTATSTAFIRFCSSANSFPANITSGKVYYIKHNASKIGVQVAAYYNNSTSDYEYVYSDVIGGPFLIPSAATGLMIRINIASGVTVNETINVPKVLTAPENKRILQLYDCNAVDVLQPLTDTPVVTMSSVGITFKRDKSNKYSFSGTASALAFIRYFYSASSFPEGIQPGGTYYVKFKGQKVGFQIFAYFNNNANDYQLIYSSLDSGKVTIPDTATGIMIRVDIVAGMTVNETIDVPQILTAESNAALTNIVESDARAAGYVTLIADDQFYVRSAYDSSRDSVLTFKYPDIVYAYNFNFNDIRLIPKSTPIEDTVSAYNASVVYKDMHDDIPAIMINGVLLGSNHGNPYFTRVNCTHSIPQSMIGTVWTDENSNSYTLVQVFPTFLVFGTLDVNGDLIVRDPSTLTRGGDTITPVTNEAVQLRRSSIDRTIRIINNNGEDCLSGGRGTEIKVFEQYDIQDQAKMLSWLQANTGNLTNASCYSDNIPYKLARIKNTFVFNSNSTITIYGTITALDNITVDKLYGGMSIDFHSLGAGNDYGFVPLSNEFATPVAIDYNNNMYITPSSDGVPYRFYQLSSLTDGKGAFLHLIDYMGDSNPSIRENLNPFAWYAASPSEKLYLQILQNVSLTNGKSLSWGYGKGIFKKVSGQYANTCFKLNNSWIVSIDFSAAYNGYIELPEELDGATLTVMEQSPDVNAVSDFVSNNGIKINATAAGYVVLLISPWSF